MKALQLLILQLKVGGSIDAAAPAVDVQNQSEEMIKHLIEGSNNQTDI